MHPIIPYIKAGLKKNGDSDRASQMQRYMKTNQLFYGVQAKVRKKLFKDASNRYPVGSRQDYEAVVRVLWKGEFREEMYQALEVAEGFRPYHQKTSWPLYEHLVFTAPHWDTLDWIASRIIGPLVLKDRSLEAYLDKWSDSDNFWVRRASLLSHLKHKAQTNTKLLRKTILKMAHEKEFFIRKAIGWVLRDYAYADPEWVVSFVTEFSDKLSNLSKKEAIKHIFAEGSHKNSHSEC